VDKDAGAVFTLTPVTLIVSELERFDSVSFKDVAVVVCVKVAL